ncbi:MAG TPA: flagellar hook-length control protein FliK [Pyrinomonadaceae bacterium]|jgi:hypothetical protein|nr:flagellar hook-length control protein FliK [Pyrinomonadaceae bacterium]
MKIPPPTTKFPERPTTEPDRNAHKHVNTQPASTEPSTKPGALGGGAASRRDFASVLKEVTRNNSARDEHEGESRDERRETSGAGDVDGQRETVREEEGHGDAGGGGGLGARAGVESTYVSETTSTRAILHIADLEKIVAAVRSRLYADGRSEVTLELKRSVLEGLRVKLGADETGRVTAEFIAATERVRAQLDARTGDLAEMLRSRGVNLASIKTSVNADTSEQRERQSEQRLAASAPTSADGSASVQDAASVETQDEDSTRSGATYRA